MLTHIPSPSGAPFERAGSSIRGLGFSSEGKLLAAGTDDGVLQIWDVARRTMLRATKVGWGYVSNPAVSPDGSLVAAGTYADGTLSLLDAAYGKLLSQIQVSEFGCGSVAFSGCRVWVVGPSGRRRRESAKPPA